MRNLVYACIAKRPEDRPATAAHLARAAQALRRGDVQGAIAAVPGVAGHDPISSFATDTQAATRVISAGAAGYGAAGYGAAAGAAGAVATPTTATEPIARKRNPWVWPLVAIVSVLAVALIAIIIVLLVRPSDGPAPTPSRSTTPSASKTPSATPTPTATATVINRDDYIGKPFDQVASALGNLGYGVNQANGPAASTPSQEGTVSNLTHTGAVPKGKEITVYVYQPYPGPPAPSAATAPAGPQHGTITIAWTRYAGCPSGYQLTGYVFNGGGSSNYTVHGGNTVGADATSVDIDLSPTASSATVTYQASCGTSGMQSAVSNPLTIPIG